MSDLPAYKDPDHEGNSKDHHTGKPCVEPRCDRPAGTAWSPYWCFECNVERMDRIDGNLEEIRRRMSR